jgi:hypothetical protein
LAEIGIFGFFFLCVLGILTSFLRIFVLTHLLLTQVFLWPLDAFVPTDLRVPTAWLIDMLVPPLELLLVFLV